MQSHKRDIKMTLFPPEVELPIKDRKWDVQVLLLEMPVMLKGWSQLPSVALQQEE